MKVILFLAEGFEEVEALTVVDYLRRKDILVDTISITDNETVKGAHDIIVITDKKIDEVNELDSYDGVVIPGGMPGASNLRDDNKVIEIIRTMNDSGKLVASICAGPMVLERAGVIKGKKVTSYPGYEKVLKDCIYKEEPVVIDGNIITSRGPYLAVEFSIEIIKYLHGHEKAEELKKDILYKY